MENYDNKKKNIFLTILLYGFLTILALVIIYLYYSIVLPYVVTLVGEKENDEKMEVDTEYLYSEFVSGNGLEAAARMEELMRDDFFAPDEAVELKLVYANYLYRNPAGNNKTEALNIVTNIIDDPIVSSANKAEAIRLFLNFAYDDADLFSVDRSEFLYIVNFPALNQFNNEYIILAESDDSKDWNESLQILASYAHGLESHSYTAMLLASWYSGQLSNLNDESVRQDYAYLVNSYINEADGLLEKEKVSGDISVGLRWNDANFYYWKGEALANLELANMPATQSFEEAFIKAIELQSRNNDKESYYSDLSMQIRFLYAIYLNEIYGADREEDIDFLLTELVDMSDSNSRANDSFVDFVSYLETTHDYEGSSVHDLATINEGFENYMIGLGWDFESVD